MSAILLSLTLLGAAAEVQTRETPTTRLFVQTTPSGAAIKLDGKAEGTTPKVFVVPRGATKMIVEVELDGHASQRREVVIQGGRVTRIQFQLEPKPVKIEAGLPANQASTRVYALKHNSAAEASRVLRQALSDKFRNKSDARGNRISVGVDTRSNSIIVAAVPEDHAMVEQVLRQADVLSKQSGATGDTAKLLVQQAEAEFTRVERLFEKGYVTQSEYGRAKRGLDRARAAAEKVKTSVAGHGNPAAPTDAGKAAQSAESAKQSPTPGSVTNGNAGRRHTEQPPEPHAKPLYLRHTDADNPEPGAPIEEEKLQRLAWGPAAPNGLRAACYFEPTKEAYADGEEVVRRLVFHNSGKEPVLFTYGSASENSHQDWVVVEEPISVPVERQFGLGGGWSVTYRLASGHAIEEWSPRVGLGASAKAGQGVHAAIQAKPGTTCRARWSLRVLETMRSENGKRVPVTSVWHGTLTTGEVRFRIVAKEADRAPKESLR